MFKKLTMSLFILFCFKSCKSQSKEELIQFDLNEPKIYYSILGELRGRVKEIIETSTSTINSPINGRLTVNHENKSIFDNDKHIINQYDKAGLLYSTMYFDSKWLLDSIRDSNMRVCCPFKTPFHEQYINYCVEKDVKSVLNYNKIDSISNTVSVSFFNKISSIDSFDVKNRKVQVKSFDFKDSYSYYKYNNEGDLIGEYSKRPNEELELTQLYEYEYDQNKNWTKKINTNRPNDLNPAYNTFKTIYKRKIIYVSN
jgi:hypothetical protein